MRYLVRGHAGHLNWDERLSLIGATAHADAGDQVDIETSEFRGAQEGRDVHTDGHPALGDPPARGENEPELITDVSSRSCSQRLLSIIEGPGSIVQIDIDRVPRIAAKPSEEGRGALQDPSVRVFA